MTTPLDREYWQWSLRDTGSNFPAADDMEHISELVRRENSAAGGTGRELPIQLIIGIAIAGFAVVFCTLTAIACYCARSRHRHPKGNGRTPELEQGKAEMAMALRSHPPHAITLGRETPYPIFASRSNSKSRVPEKQSTDYEDGFNSDYRSPPRFRLTGLRDSWPLGGWSLSTPPRSQDQPQATTHIADPSRLGSHSRISSQMIERSQSLRTGTTKYGEVVVNDIGPAIRSTHSAKGSLSSLRRPSLQRRSVSVSDDHLTSILRSTSHRLRDSHRISRPRATSIMSYASGPPPGIRPPSLPTDDPTASREGLIDPDEALYYAESVKSSVLSMYSRSGSPGKKITTRGSIDEFGKRLESLVSDDDSICGKRSVEIVIPAGLTSPSKKRRTAERHKVQISSEDNSPAKTQESSRASMFAFGSTGLFDSKSSSSTSDPFVSGLTIQKRRSTGARIQLQRKATFGAESKINPADIRASLPLRAVSGNFNAPIKETVMTINAEPNPFQWSPQVAKTSIDVHMSTGIKKRGHKRSQTVRVSGLPRAMGNVSTVHEEVENESNSPSTPNLKQPPPVLHFSSPGSPDPFSDYKISPGLSLVHTFQPLLSVPPTKGSIDMSDRASQVSYPLSVYDYYSNVDIFNVKSTNGVQPPPAARKARRHAQDFSMGIASNPSLHHSVHRNSLSTSAIPIFPPPSKASASRSPSMNSISTIGNENEQFPPSPPHSETQSPLRLLPSPTRMYGPRLQPGSDSPPRTSVASSVNLLRRMNSQLSQYAHVSARSSAAFGGLGNSPRIQATPPLPTQILEQSRDTSPQSSLHKSSPGTQSPKRSVSTTSARKSVRIAETILEYDSPAPRETKASRDSSPTLASCLKRHSTDFCLSPERMSPGRERVSPTHSNRSSSSSLISPFNLGLGLGLRLTRDGSPTPLRRRKSSMRGIENLRGGRAGNAVPPVPWMSTIPNLTPMPERPPLNATYIVPRSPDRSPTSEKGTDVLSERGRRGNESSSGTPREVRDVHDGSESPDKNGSGGVKIQSPQAQAQVPMWGKNWRRSLGLYDYDSQGLYDKDGFLMSSPSAAPPMVESPGKGHIV